MALVAVVITFVAASARGDNAVPFDRLQTQYSDQILPTLRTFCLDCHSTENKEGELDLERFETLADVRHDPKAWQRVAEMIDNGEMPPKDSEQPTVKQRQTFRDWVAAYLDAEALAGAGDPGPVVLRRLSNAEYNYTIRDLTGIVTLNPTDEFPVDGAAGEGFTNTGSAQAMSPALVQKYLDAAKQVASHAAFFPSGVRFSRHTSRRDLTDELLEKIRATYARYTVDGNATAVDLQGIRFDTNEGGVLPVGEYVAAMVAQREALRSGAKTIADVARERNLSPVYLQTLSRVFEDESVESSFLLRKLRQRWQSIDEDEVAKLVTEIGQWQTRLWKFNVVGHVGREGAPTSWMEAVVPARGQQEFRLPLPSIDAGKDITVFLSAVDAGDGTEGDYVLWRDMRLTAPGQRDIQLRDVRGIWQQHQQLRREILGQTEASLEAAAEVLEGGISDETDVARIAEKHGIRSGVLWIWLDYLSIGIGGPVAIEGHFTDKMQRSANYEFVQGWGTPQTPSVVANSSDQQVRIPGISRPHSVVVHPAPTVFVAVGWQSPIDGVVRVDASLSDAHPECGNGVEWFVQHLSGSSANTLWQGDFAGAGSAKMPMEEIVVGKGEVITLIVGPRNGDHSCDLTQVDLKIAEVGGERRVWDLAADNSPNILAGNPHSDRFGNKRTWHFYQGPMTDIDSDPKAGSALPSGSLLARWLAEPDQRATLAKQIAGLVNGPPPSAEKESSPDGVLYRNLHWIELPADDERIKGIEPDSRFGKHALGHNIDPNHIVVRAPSTLEFRIPADIARGRELVVVGMPDVEHGQDGTTQLHVGFEKPTADMLAGNPIIVADESNARARVEAALSELRDLFPPALCYTRIVPVDEVVTATLFHREDELYKRLMLTEDQDAELDRLWDELRYVSEEPLKSVVALEQIREFSTQDRQDLVPQWDKLRPAIQARAKAFRQHVKDSQPTHLESVLQIADRAWRRPLAKHEEQSLRDLYQRLRDSELSHEQSIRLTLARVFTSPAFLYRLEQPGPSDQAAAVTNHELATRLSYFLWSSLPDEELRHVSDDGTLADETILVAQARRMLKDDRVRRLAVHFACQWMHVRDFDQNDDKNEALYPEFAELRGPMYEETVRFFEDMFRNDGSVLGIIDANHTFLNETLAGHYGINNVTGSHWRRVEGVRAHGRGGVLAMATFLASQSGASRTSPILRGNWVFETLLGQRLPRPPADVPQLPDSVPGGLTARQLIEQHSSVAQCAVCHARIDPYGFALENFDAIGRLRSEAVDVKTTISGGETIEGIDGLRDFLMNQRRDEIVRQFCRKLLGYALGREVQISDQPLLAEMGRQLAKHDYRFSVAVDAIVKSRQFREIRGVAFGR